MFEYYFDKLPSMSLLSDLDFIRFIANKNNMTTVSNINAAKDCRRSAVRVVTSVSCHSFLVATQCDAFCSNT